MNEELISVVVPIYNVEKYLDKCVSSIVNQSYTNLEIILVDDGSTDNSGKLCEKWIQEDERIRVIHKENGGLSSARNEGLKIAQGEYIVFVDSDDYIEKDIIKICYEQICTANVDLIIFGYRTLNENYKTILDYKFEEKEYNVFKLNKDFYNMISNSSFGYVWNKMYKIKILKSNELIFNTEIDKREDLIFNLSLLKYIKKFKYINNIGYNYLQRSTSLLHSNSLIESNNIKKYFDILSTFSINGVDFDYIRSYLYLQYSSDCIVKNIFNNIELNFKEKAIYTNKLFNIMKNYKIIYNLKYPLYIKILFISFKIRIPQLFMLFNKISNIKNKMKGRLK